MALQSSSSSSKRFDYDVFLSFRGSDTRYGFTGNLYDALTKRGIRTFMDDKELKGGEEITPAFRKAIEDSRICIPIFSINYVDSSFCLDELDHIMSCLDSSKPEEDRLVLPVFYGVEPTHLQHHTSSYRVALDNHEKRLQDNKEKYTHNMERLEKWKTALTRAANLSGRPFNPPASSNMARNEETNLADHDHTFDPTGKVYEYKFIENIVDFVSNKINRTPLHVVNNCVGLKSRVSQVVSLLNMGGSDDRVIMVGIHGIGGIGKTTLAREIYNSIANQFRPLCFLENVRHKADQHGLEHLQKTLLHEAIGEKDIAIGCSSKGNSIIKQRLQKMKVLLILDDVDKLQQLKDLAGEDNWFGSGSRVIITTRDKKLLADHGIKRTYEVVELNKHEALELLKWNAFKNSAVHSSYDEILNRAVTYASGLPLALEVVGSHLCGKDPEEWEFLLDKYERIPDKEIQKILKVSFDALDEEEQSVFLNIACFFNGYDLKEVERILCAHHGFCSIKYYMSVLIGKSLIKVHQRGLVKLHDLIEDMGKEIVRLESPKEPQKRSRLWSSKDIIHVLKNNKGTSKIEIIILDCGSTDEVVDWNAKVFKKMRNLKTLIIIDRYGGHCYFSDGPRHFSNSLRVLFWHGYSQSIPSILLNKKLKDMRLLSFRNCRYLIEIPDISNLPNLEELYLESCENLKQIHKSVGVMKKLKILEVEYCNQLTSFPPEIKLPSLEKFRLSSCGALQSFPPEIKLPSLQKFRLSSCRALQSFPEILGGMENITQFELSGTREIRLPISILTILTMSRLSRVRLSHCQLQIDSPDSTESSNVKILELAFCNLSDDVLAIVLKMVANVEELSIKSADITILPECIRECRFLTKLGLPFCLKLKEIRALPPNLKFLNARFFTLVTGSSYKSMLNKELHERGGTHFCYSNYNFPRGTEGMIPKWFKHQSVGNSISFWFRKSVPSIALFFQSSSMNKNRFWLSVCLRINGNEYALNEDWILSGRSSLSPNETHLLDVQLHENKKLISELGEELLRNEWIHAEIAFNCDFKSEPEYLLEIGIHVFEQKTNKDDIQFTDPYERKRKFDEVTSMPSQEDTSARASEVTHGEVREGLRRSTRARVPSARLREFVTS